MRIAVQSGHCLFESGEAALVRILDSEERELVQAQWAAPNVFVAPELLPGRYEVSFVTCSVRHLPSGQSGTLSTVLPFHLAVTDAEIEQGTIALPIPGKTLLKITALKDGAPVPDAKWRARW